MLTIKRWLRRSFWTLAIIFILLNLLTALHAWKFTHYDPELQEKPVAENLTTAQKIRAAFLGVSLPRPENTTTPSRSFEEVALQHEGRIHCWWVPKEGATETVILFHGYGDSKSSMVDRAGAFRRMGCHTMLVDFTGSGASDGSVTTIGYREAAEVRACLQWVEKEHPGKVHLFGMSLGAAAILKAVQDGAAPASIILECPFGTLLQAVKNRCRMMKMPAFPVAQLLTFWGGVEHGFDAFSHNPQDYAQAVRCPALLMWGEKGDRVIREETDAIFAALSGPKQLVTFPEAGHENYLRKCQAEWQTAVSGFLSKGPR